MLSELLESLHSFHEKPIDLGLDRLLCLLEKLGNPHKKLPPVIHVAGTNGKGSTIAFCRSFLEAADYRVHVYTSPHLVRFHERIRLNGKLIEDDLLCRTLKEVIRINDSCPLTFFEATTAAAFMVFSETPADVVLLETGLGGRLDATNVVQSPISSIITPISLDHQEFLGNTLSKIAFEKCGIIKPKCPVVVGPQPEEVINAIKEQAFLKDAPLYLYGRDWDLGLLSTLPNPNLKGDHQRINASTAIQALSLNFSLGQKVLEKGIQSAEWRGRLQCIQEGPHEIWLDGAHNVGAAEVLADELKKWGDDKPIVAIVGMKARKDAKSFLKILAPYLKEVFVVPVSDDLESGKSYTQDALQVLAEGEGLKTKKALNFLEAIQDIQKMHSRSRTIVTGSLYLVGEVLSVHNSAP